MRKEHLLIIRFSPVSEVEMTVPVVKALAERYPELRITVLSHPKARPLFSQLAPNVSFMAADIQCEYHGVKGLNALYRRLAAKQFTAIADFHNVLRSEYLRMRFNLGRYRVEHVDRKRRRRKLFGLLRSNGAARKTYGLSALLKRERQAVTWQSYADVLDKLGYPISEPTPINNSN